MSKNIYFFFKKGRGPKGDDDNTHSQNVEERDGLIGDPFFGGGGEIKGFPC